MKNHTSVYSSKYAQRWCFLQALSWRIMLFCSWITGKNLGFGWTALCLDFHWGSWFPPLVPLPLCPSVICVVLPDTLNNSGEIWDPWWPTPIFKWSDSARVWFWSDRVGVFCILFCQGMIRTLIWAILVHLPCANGRIDPLSFLI